MNDRSANGDEHRNPWSDRRIPPADLARILDRLAEHRRVLADGLARIPEARPQLGPPGEDKSEIGEAVAGILDKGFGIIARAYQAAEDALALAEAQLDQERQESEQPGLDSL